MLKAGGAEPRELAIERDNHSMARSEPLPGVLRAILEFNAGRKPKLVRIKLERMAANPFAFFRGADHLLAGYWAQLKPPDVGPPILQCGDLHLENFGAYQTDDGDFLYDINDFDEALVAPCSLDLVRCVASILVAAECWALSPLAAFGMALEFIDRYRAAVTSPPHVHADDQFAPHTGRGPIWKLLGETAQASQEALLDANTELVKGTRRIVRNKAKHPPVSAKREKSLRHAMEAYGAAHANPEAFEVLDVTGRIAGTGSLGARRYLVLIAGGGTPETNRLIDVKEEFAPALLACAGAVQPDVGGDHAARAVAAQRALQAKPPAGLDVLPVEDLSYRMRTMIPEENRTSLSRFQRRPEKLREAIQVAGQLTGWSHLRGAQHGHRRSNPTGALVAWADSASLDAVLVSAARYAEQTRADFQAFCAALAEPKNLPKELRPRAAAKALP